jgi:hypothetical protein
MCRCLSGFEKTPNFQSCIDINECLTDPCGTGAICENTFGSFNCKCPFGTTGDPWSSCIGEKSMQCLHDDDCELFEYCLDNSCLCKKGFLRNLNNQCEDINECLISNKNVCGYNAFCKNFPGSYECSCPDGFTGNPFIECKACSNGSCHCPEPFKLDLNGNCFARSCSSSKDCTLPATCIKIAHGMNFCKCPVGYESDELGQCQDIDECNLNFPNSRACGKGAICKNYPGSYECICPPGTKSNDVTGLCTPVSVLCKNENDCQENEECKNGKCVCTPPYYIDLSEGYHCKNPCSNHECGLNAVCIVSKLPQCHCLQGFAGDPLTGCEDIDECSQKPCKIGAICINKPGSYICECPKESRGDPYVTGCFGSRNIDCLQDNDCPGQLDCVFNQCINPCEKLPCGKNAICVSENHAAWCQCKTGYHKDKEGHCVSPCKDFNCGQNAKCVISVNGPTCLCNEGMFGNPFPGGKCLPLECSLQKHCQKSNEICQNGLCVASCKGRICGLNAYCDDFSQKCQCPIGFQGDPTLFCAPPTSWASCNPACGSNSHCQYGEYSYCACNDGFFGNPYKGCIKLTNISSCSHIKCGTNSFCSMETGRPSCVCNKGFYGNNPYEECLDINECLGSVCGENAICINTNGGFDCFCYDGFIGNPFEGCISSLEVANDLCANEKCGPNAICHLGQCLCSLGYKGGDPYDLVHGCSLSSTCQSDTDCGYNEICKKDLGESQMHCKDPCLTSVCGPNSYCVTDNHQSSCICKDGFEGNPNDLVVGCIHETSCRTNSDCHHGEVCHINVNGKRVCIEPCNVLFCPTNEMCKLANEKPICSCKDGYLRDSFGVCSKFSKCQSNADCKPDEICQKHASGYNACQKACDSVLCPNGAYCEAKNHSGYCKCNSGYKGRPDERTGCILEEVFECKDDLDCLETQVCQKQPDKNICLSACNLLKCGPEAICIAKNHVGRCTCPPFGLYIGDPYNEGCKSVSCLDNEDCSEHQYCDRLSFKCLSVCTKEACGDNAICVPHDHNPVCQCEESYIPSPLPEIKCEKNVKGESCPSGLCVDACSDNRPCSKGQICKSGLCKDGCINDKDCSPPFKCINNKCQDLCSVACGPNSECIPGTAQNFSYCKCPSGFVGVPTAIQGCIRIPSECKSQEECQKGKEVCYKGYCMMVCTNKLQCAQGELCLEGKCFKACHSDKNCLQGEICTKNFCDPGCRTNTDCKTNEYCDAGRCLCSPGYIQSSEGECQDVNECASNPCMNPQFCENIPGSYICKCPDNMVHDSLHGCTVPNHCKNNSDCSTIHSCMLSSLSTARKCLNPCDFVSCAQNAECTVTNHEPICQCPTNFLGDPNELSIGCYKAECNNDSDCSTSKFCNPENSRCSGKLSFFFLISYFIKIFGHLIALTDENSEVKNS